jgi:phage tail-like protein
MQSLAEIVPAIYSTADTDGSFGVFVSVYDVNHAATIAILETLATVRIPDLAPVTFLPYIADSLGNPFPFMTGYRWQKGNKLDALNHIYSLRGSQNGIQDVVRFLCGVEIIVETDSEFDWILGTSLLGNTTVAEQSVINAG